MTTMQIWLVKHPISQYKEDVKALAREKNLKIIDEAAAGAWEREVAVKGPKLTLLSEAAQGKMANTPVDSDLIEDADKLIGPAGVPGMVDPEVVYQNTDVQNLLKHPDRIVDHEVAGKDDRDVPLDKAMKEMPNATDSVDKANPKNGKKG